MDTWARSARQACNECGSVRILWMAALELPWKCREADRRRAVEGLTLFGGDAEAWLCPDCGQFGIFGPSELYVTPQNRAHRRAQRRQGGSRRP